MEHRWFARVDAPVSAIIHTREGVCFNSIIHNISYGGVFVDIDDPSNAEGNSCIHKNNIVSVQFDDDRFAVTLLAQVIRRSDKAAALMFISHTPALRPFINKLSAPAEHRYKVASN